ncbi:isochorismate synthase [Actinoplanes sp. RD1]|uniref:isochorismate synthase n=1 Tax=Actinoplanes sp. RD1 TaxID=3064538 RepID=UPI002741FF57|nr:isochorismate synthase [Actinoplanes sp. RD1]
MLETYDPSRSSVFVSPSATLLAEGVHAVAPATSLAELPLQVSALLRAGGGEARAVVGAVPFSADAPARLVVPRRLRRGEPATLPARPDVAARGHSVAETDDGYVAAVARALKEIDAGAYTKVVLARALRLPAPALDVAAVVRGLIERGAGRYTFGIDLGAGRTLFGASPELLVSRHGGIVTAHPLAGSAPRSADPDEDARRAAALLVSAKDRHEHAFVSEQVAAVLRPYCRALHVPDEPELVATPTMWHLASRITGRVAHPDTTALTLAAALHPTPAVCGTPVASARRAIAELESFDRGFYAGMVGWTDAAGDGEWAVTIRCAVAGPEGLDVYAGAGVVTGSDPAAELAETNAKLGTMLTALGVADVAR